jgi:hypothetical protein
VRDKYRAYLENKGCGPLMEMYWVVFRYGVKDWAVMILRSAAFSYIGDSRISTEHWNSLFDFSGPFNDLLRSTQKMHTPDLFVHPDQKLSKTIKNLLPQAVFDEVRTGGPFGRDAQIRFAASFPGKAVLLGEETLPDAIDRRLRLWDGYHPWTEGLARMFDAAQGEILSQYDALGSDARRAEADFLNLSRLHQIAYKHLMTLRSGAVAKETMARDRWLPLLRELDSTAILLDRELQGNARETLMHLRKKGVQIRTWEECYASTAMVVIGNQKARTLRREVTHFIHNAAKKAAYQLGKIWNHETKAKS